MDNDSEGDIRSEEKKNAVPPEVALPEVPDLHERHLATMQWMHGRGRRIGRPAEPNGNMGGKSST
jgi:hypothetical protein